MVRTGESEDLATVMAEVARDLLAQDSLDATLDRIAHHAVAIVAGCHVAGIMEVRSGAVTNLAATDELVCESDRLQGELAEGPCFDATEHRTQVYRIGDLTDATPRWPRYVPRARALGIGSMMGFLLFTRDEHLGALNLYSYHPDAFTEHSEKVGWLLASHAAVAFSAARSDDQLHGALRTRQEIGQATGIVRERYGLGEDQAFAVLVRASQDQQVKLKEIAHEVVTTGRIPGAR